MSIELTPAERETERKRKALEHAQRTFRKALKPIASQPANGSTKAERKAAKLRRKAARTELYLSRGR